MRHRILTALGVLAAVTGFASSVHAQPTAASSSKTGELTLSGESLVGIKDRTVGDDFNRFFVVNSPPTIPSSTGNASTTIGSNNNATTPDPGVLQVSDNVQIISNEPIYAPITRVPGQQNEPFHNADRAQVQIGLD